MSDHDPHHNPSLEVREALLSAVAHLERLGVSAEERALILERSRAELALSTDSRLLGWGEMIASLPPLERHTQSEDNPSELTPQALYSLSVSELRWRDANETTAREQLKQLMPWRKGPITLGPTHIDTEWRSDWKWARVAPHVELKGAHVLDVGGGNGYYGWRMLEAGAESALMIDPTRQFFYQHLAVCRALSELCALTSAPPPHHLPLTLEAFTLSEPHFDVVFSMGVLYHRRDPIEHLRELKAHLKPGGQLVLETLVHEGEGLLEIEGRYANMRNMWALPSVELLSEWLCEAGFEGCVCVDLTPTTTEEQRRTEWMTFYSLAEALNPNDPRLTIEGHPAPVRATLVGRG